MHTINNARRPQNRLPEKLWAYWDGLRRDRTFPSESEIEPEALGEMWDACFLVKLPSGDAAQYRYTYLGDRLIETFGDDRDRENSPAHFIDPIGEPLAQLFREVADGRPVMDEAEFINERSMRIKYRTCLLPLGKDHVDYILGGMKWKAC